MKRIIAIMLILMLILSQTVFAGEISEVVKTDLYSLGIMVGDEGGNLNLDKDITRAEAAKMICVVGGLKKESNGEAFTDLDSNHWAYEYVCAVVEKKLMTKNNGRFDPYGTVTNEEIVSMLVRLLGYEANAIVFGGGNSGYVAVGAKIGITESMQFEVNTPAKRGDVAKMIYNSLDIPIMVREKIESGIVWKIMDGKGDIPLETLRTKIKE